MRYVYDHNLTKRDLRGAATTGSLGDHWGGPGGFPGKCDFAVGVFCRRLPRSTTEGDPVPRIKPSEIAQAQRFSNPVEEFEAEPHDADDHVRCPACGPTGQVSGCPTCNGAGIVKR